MVDQTKTWWQRLNPFVKQNIGFAIGLCTLLGVLISSTATVINSNNRIENRLARLELIIPAIQILQDTMQARTNTLANLSYKERLLIAAVQELQEFHPGTRQTKLW